MDRELNHADNRPLPAQPRIAVVGSGAVGAYYGGRLAQHGHDVHFLVRSDYEAVKKNGWTIRSCDGDFVLPPASLNVYDEPEAMPRVDLVLVTLKTTSNDAYPQLIGPLLGDNTCILTIQNGLGNEDRLAELFGAQRVLGGMAFVCINRIAPGVIHHIEHGQVRLGEFAAHGAEAASSAARSRSPNCSAARASAVRRSTTCAAVDGRSWSGTSRSMDWGQCWTGRPSA